MGSFKCISMHRDLDGFGSYRRKFGETRLCANHYSFDHLKVEKKNNFSLQPNRDSKHSKQTQQRETLESKL